MAPPIQVTTSNEESKQLLMLPYKGKAGETRLKSLWNTLKSFVPANNTCRIIYTGTKLASKFPIIDEICKTHKHELIYKAQCPNLNCDRTYIHGILPPPPPLTPTTRKLGSTILSGLGDLKFSRAPGGAYPNGGFEVFHTLGTTGFLWWTGAGEDWGPKLYSSLRYQGKSPPVDSPSNFYSYFSYQKFIPPLNKSFHVITKQKLHF